MIRTMTGPTTFDECNLLAIRRAARYVTQLYERHLSAAGVTAAVFDFGEAGAAIASDDARAGGGDDDGTHDAAACVEAAAA